MTVLLDGFDIGRITFDFFQGSEINFFSMPKEKPFLNSSRYCFPYPFYPFINFVFYPKKFLEKNNINLIYSFKVFPLNKLPWIADVEEIHYINAFCTRFPNSMNSIGLSLIKKGLKSDYCKKIVCLSEYSKKTVESFGGKKLAEKTIVSFPISKPVKSKNKKQKEKISLLFVATNPNYKGTEFVFSAFNELTKKYDVELNCFGNFPEETIKQFPEINFNLVSSTEFKEKVLPNQDILLMPSLMESFGFTALQALSNSIPVISSDIMALPEINHENKTGFLIKFPEWYHKKLFFNPFLFSRESVKLNKKEIISQLIEKTSLLIEDSSLRKQFGRNGLSEVEKGKFSVKFKQKQMKELFGELT